jgi:putative PIN family toxin of toxin-antitoxin system
MARRVVLDTNALVAGLRSTLGASFRLLELAGTGRFTHALCVPLLFEYEDALKRPRTGARIPGEAVDDVLDYLCATGIAVEIHFLWRPVLSDPGDDLVLEVAVNGECDTIVTLNRGDFRGASSFGLHVLTPRQFLHQLGATP